MGERWRSQTQDYRQGHVLQMSRGRQVGRGDADQWGLMGMAVRLEAG